MSDSKRLYDSLRWRRVRRSWLALHPLCEYCHKAGRVTAAHVVDHIIPHKNDIELFWDSGNYQSLCHTCHSSAKQRADKRGKETMVGLDGWRI